MSNQPPILTADPNTGRVYVVTDYLISPRGFTALDQCDVTEQYLAIVKYHAETGRLGA